MITKCNRHNYQITTVITDKYRQPQFVSLSIQIGWHKRLDMRLKISMNDQFESMTAKHEQSESLNNKNDHTYKWSEHKNSSIVHNRMQSLNTNGWHII